MVFVSGWKIRDKKNTAQVEVDNTLRGHIMILGSAKAELHLLTMIGNMP